MLNLIKIVNSEDYTKALELLKKHNISIDSDPDPLKNFYIMEAPFRLGEIEILGDNQEKYNNLDKESKKAVQDIYIEKLCNSDRIFDYDYLDDLANDAFDEYCKDNIVE